MNRIIIPLLLLMPFFIQAQIDPLKTLDAEQQQIWVDSILNTMTIDEKIGQLFMVQAYSNKDKKHEKFITSLIQKDHIGGLIFMQGTPEKQAVLNNVYQEKTKTPLLIGFDGEWGLAMRLKNTYRFPWNMTLGAIRDNNLVEKFGKRLGEHCKRLGIHINFAPVVDINTNPENPIIGNRSFGENKENVTQKSLALIKGMQSVGVLANAKHFPGHGDTATDSHHTLPVLNFDINRLDSVELYPYKRLFKEGVASVMTAHLSIPSLESNTELPTSLSTNVVTNLLQNKLGFKGLVITDGLNMKGAANYATSAEINLAAIIAGNDILLIPHDIPKTVALIKKSIENKVLTENRINVSVIKILKAKYWAGLHQYKPIQLENLQQDLNAVSDELLHRKLIKNSLTILKSEESVLPIKSLSNKKIAYVKLGDAKGNSFVKMLKNYTRVDVVSDKNLDRLLQKLNKYDLVIIGYHKSNKNPWKSYKFTNKELVWLQEISRKNKVILDVFASPYSLLQLKSFTNIEGVMVSYQNSKLAQEISAQAVFGAISVQGKLPVSIRNEFSEGYGLVKSSLSRLQYTIPAEAGMSSKKLKEIDSIFNTVIIRKKMAPGGQVLVARNGKIIFHKKYGYHTYDKKEKVQLTDLYDLASVTKILGGLPMIMKSEENGLFTIDTKLGKLLPYLKGSNKDTITLKEALSHNGKIVPWIPYYIRTLDSVTKKPLSEYYSTKRTRKFSIKVADELYLKDNYTDTIYKRIAEVPQRERAGYRYSGLLFYLFKKYLKTTYKREMDVLNEQFFYKPLGANTLMYNPLKKFKKSKIVPTEVDDYYRYQTLQGYVHDMGAAMMNGVSGNAGLFSNANDVAKMMQMYLQKGFYGGYRYLKTSTIDMFNKRYYKDENVRRGLGFDKPQLDSVVKATCGCVSSKSFGHSGFTGTYTWADPESGILYVFLSNRVYPTMKNNALGKSNVRTIIQQIIQDAIIE